jgi:hypothetical protein
MLSVEVLVGGVKVVVVRVSMLRWSLVSGLEISDNCCRGGVVKGAVSLYSVSQKWPRKCTLEGRRVVCKAGRKMPLRDAVTRA